MDNVVRILVTGGSGFIGTNIIEYYSSKGVVVINLDKNSPRNESQSRYWKNVDILNAAELQTAIVEFDPTHVCHLAARTDLDEKKNIEGYDANTKGTENVIAALSQCHNLKRVLFTSSMYVCYPGYNPKNYDDYAPHTVYGESKRLTEKIIKANAHRYEWVIIRPTSLWGPWFGIPYNEFFHRVIQGSFFKVSGKTATKTFGFVLNAIHQMDTLLFCDKNLVHEKTFYIGDSPGLNINEWADEIASQLGKKLMTIPFFVLKCGGWFGDILASVGIRFPLQSFRVGNMTTDNVIGLLQDTVKITGEKPFTTKEGIRITLDWIKKHG